MWPPSVKGALYGQTDSVFLGRVIKEITPEPQPLPWPRPLPGPHPMPGPQPLPLGPITSQTEEKQMPYYLPMQRQFLVKVRRVYKGCDFDCGDTVIVTTGSDGAMCGVYLQEKKHYLLTGHLVKADDVAIAAVKERDIAAEVSIVSCEINTDWKYVSYEDKKLLWKYAKLDRDCGTGCESGADCLKNDYCDAGRCIDSTATCPFYVPVVHCLVDPCENEPCKEAGEGGRCLSNYCGGCHAICIDKEGNRVYKNDDE